MTVIDLEQYRPDDPTRVWGLHFDSPEAMTEDALSVETLFRLVPAAQSLVIDPRARVPFRGGWTCACVAESLPYVEQAMLDAGLIRQSIDIYQLGYRTDVTQSAGTHAKGWAVDVGQYSLSQLAVWWDFGWAMQHRTPAQGFINHGHGGPNGCTHGSPLAMWQLDQYLDGRNGLVSNGPAAGPRGNLPTYQTALKQYLSQKEQDMPSPQEVWNSQIPNLATGDKKTDTASTGFTLGQAYRQSMLANENAKAARDESKATARKIDALTAALKTAGVIK